MYRLFVKRILDIFLSLTLIILLSPLFIILSFIVLINMGWPILFSQERIGKDEKIFRLYKFRSMTNAKDKDGKFLPENERLTKFGILLRSTSLDELPELIMILFGKMSFIGPRPQPKFYGPYYNENERIAHRVKGGLLPPDSLLGNVQCDWDTQLKCESYYAEHVTFILDIKILIATFKILFGRIKTHYGDDDRPMLNIERKNMKISDDIKKEWERKGVYLDD